MYHCLEKFRMTLFLSYMFVFSYKLSYKPFTPSLLFFTLLPSGTSGLPRFLVSALLTSPVSSVLSFPHQRGRLRHSADESGPGELRHTAALCPAGEQDPAALAPTRCAHRSGRGSGGCEYAPTHSVVLLARFEF